ncbi:hypothetical protein [Proteus phage 3H10_20]|uniref:Uncharacterized protein n=1 Tax=Proteus phage 3H10_20 TaxID=2772448 RepID=A0A7L7SNL4_9CAUD|nr:hypothetical protein PQC37_gp101 [Proteus phage 3H10_20]QOC54887.1 hypothetical protein [Proteus phage 3H10_20]
MNIEITEKEKKFVKFCDLNFGDTFQFKGNIYLKIRITEDDDINSVNLSENRLAMFHPTNTHVEKVKTIVQVIK